MSTEINCSNQKIFNNSGSENIIKINYKKLYNNKLDIDLNRLNSFENKNTTTSWKNLYFTNSDGGLFKSYFTITEDTTH